MNIARINLFTNNYAVNFRSTKQNHTVPNQYGIKAEEVALSDISRPVFQRITNIDFEEYNAMSATAKTRLRKIYSNFQSDKLVNKAELFDPHQNYLPLRAEENMDSFLDVAKMYSELKDKQILCLGRSPKWFLNAALWMKNGIKDYKFVAFSKYWYRPDYEEGIKRLDACAPKAEEVTAYRKYLKRIKADPISIVNEMKNNGRKTVITDYIATGKGASSFLEILGDYAKDEGVLEEFSKAIEIKAIGSMQYLMDHLYHEDENVSYPEVIMPEVLKKYENNIKQSYYDIKDYRMFEEMLLNQNTNECRSTFYPHSAWSIYNPDRFKIGLIKDMKKVKEMKSRVENLRVTSFFSPAMRDFRNLLNFRILDGLAKRGLLKLSHFSKI